jgi:hypothetical protein
LQLARRAPMLFARASTIRRAFPAHNAAREEEPHARVTDSASLDPGGDRDCDGRLYEICA